MNPVEATAATWRPAANVHAPPHRWGAKRIWYAEASASIRIASVIPPAIERSGWNTSAARSSARSRKSKRVNSLSPVAIGMSVLARTSASPRLSSAVTGSSNQPMLHSATSRQNRLASATFQVPCASHMMVISGSRPARAARTRRTESATSPSPVPTRILTALKLPRSTKP